MKNNLKSSITAMTLFFLAIPVQLIAQDQQEQKNEHVRYTITDLGLAADQAGGINNKGWLDFTRILADGSIHATLRREGVATDLGTLGGPNSSAFFGPSERGQVVGKAEKSTPDPLGEDSCFYFTHLLCLGFVWQNGVMTPLATLGGNNSQANNINNSGQVVGQAENTTPDPTCPPPQVLQNKPVIWEGGEIQELPTVPGDPDGVAFRINDKGQVVGASANCSIPFHAVLWQRNRHDEEQARRFDADDWTVTDLGNLGGTMNNVAQGINNRGQVVGGSDLTGDATGHAFLWTEDNGMQDLDTLPGDFGSYAFSINDKGQVVGLSGDVNGNRAFLWQDGVMTDLNKVIPPSFPFVLIEAFDINARGEIVGLAIDPNKHETHGFLLTPCDEEHANDEGCKDEGTAVAQGETSERPKAVLPESVRKMLRQRLGLRYGIPSPMSGTGAISGSNATLSPTSLTFSTQAIGTTSAAKNVTLKNAGTTSLTISSITITGINAADFLQTHTCGSSLAAGASCSISVTFKPTASGTRTAALSVSDNAAASPQKVSLSGTGTAAKLFPTSLHFGFVQIGTTSAAQTVTLTNVGTTTLTITGITITGTNAADFLQTHACESSLAVGASCSISVTFKPTQIGIRTATLSVADNASGSPQTVPLVGGCIPQGGACYGPGPNHCCPAPRGHHSFCSNPTGWGTCIES